MIAEDLHIRAKTEKMRKKQESSPVERRGWKPAFADLVLSDANPNDACSVRKMCMLVGKNRRALKLLRREGHVMILYTRKLGGVCLPKIEVDEE